MPQSRVWRVDCFPSVQVCLGFAAESLVGRHACSFSEWTRIRDKKKHAAQQQAAILVGHSVAILVSTHRELSLAQAPCRPMAGCWCRGQSLSTFQHGVGDHVSCASPYKLGFPNTWRRRVSENALIPSNYDVTPDAMGQRLMFIRNTTLHKQLH